MLAQIQDRETVGLRCRYELENPSGSTPNRTAVREATLVLPTGRSGGARCDARREHNPDQTSHVTRGAAISRREPLGRTKFELFSEARMSIANDITTSLRLSCREAKIIRIGLFSIANGHELWRARGSPPYSPARMLFQRCRVDDGEYSAEYLANVSRVAVTATFTSQSRRLQLDPFELAACALSVRVTEMQVRHGHIEGWLPNPTGA